MNTVLLLWTIVISGLISSALRIIAGFLGMKKSERYTCMDAIAGIIVIVLYIIVLST